MTNRRNQNTAILSILNPHEKSIQALCIPDLACAAALVSMNFPLKDVEAYDAQKIKFVFDNSVEAEECVRAYFEGSLRVNPRAFFDNVKMLKTRIHLIEVENGAVRERY